MRPSPRPSSRGLPQSEVLEELEALAKQILVEQMKRRKLGYAELSRQLERLGIFETPDRINRKVNRSRFPASFLLACLLAMGVEAIDLCSADVSSSGRQERLAQAKMREWEMEARRRRPLNPRD